MDQFKVYRVVGSEEQLREVIRGASDSPLGGSLQAMATEMVSRATGDPLTTYLCADDDHRSERDLVALSIAGFARERLPGILVVDCDFAQPGLGGLVPSVESLGFLDQILYGSSLKSIIQHSENGVGVVGAGSFAVTKRMPFLMDAFDESSRYLCSLAPCVVFVGPLYGDDGEIHPLAARVDIPAVVSTSSGDAAVLESIEDKLAAAVTAPVWAIRLGGATADVARKPRQEAELPSGVDELLQKPPTPPQPGELAEDEGLAPLEDVPFEEEGPFEEEVSSSDALDVKSWNSSFPKFVTTTLAIFLIGFLFWFLYLTKSMRQETTEPADLAQTPLAGPETSPVEPPGRSEDRTSDGTLDVQEDDRMAAAKDSALSARALSRKPTADASPVDASPASPVPRTGTSDGKPADVSTTVPTELTAYAGKYLVHISSFRGASRAQSDVSYFDGRGYDVVVARVDLGEKGKWYRVYIGPFESRDDAVSAKITLDENPRVRSTRITKVPGQRSSPNES